MNKWKSTAAFRDKAHHMRIIFMSLDQAIWKNPETLAVFYESRVRGMRLYCRCLCDESGESKFSPNVCMYVVEQGSVGVLWESGDQ